MRDLIIASAEPWGSSGGMLRLIKLPAHRSALRWREWTKGSRTPLPSCGPPGAPPAQGPISIRRELILAGVPATQTGPSQGEEELMPSPHWSVSSAAACQGLAHGFSGRLHRPDWPVTDMCSLANTVSRQELDERRGLAEPGNESEGLNMAALKHPITAADHFCLIYP